MQKQPKIAFILVTVFIDVLGFGLIIPVLPTLISTFTSSSAEQVHWYGLLAACYGLMQLLFTPLLGALSDQFGRRKVLLLSNFGLGLSYLLMLSASSLYMILIARMVSGATAASLSVANAYVADISTDESRSKSFGLIGAALGIGFIFGPMLGGLLGAKNVHYPFFLAAVLALTNWLYGFFVLPESLDMAYRKPVTLRAINPFFAILHIFKLKRIGALVTVFALVMLAQSLLQTTWVMFTQLRFAWGPKENGMALFVVGIVAVVTQGFLLTPLLKKWGEQKLICLGLLSSICVYIAYGLSSIPWLMYVFIFANFLSFAIVPTMQTYITQNVDKHEQGITQGSLTAISSLMMVIAPIIGSALLARGNTLNKANWQIGGAFFLGAALYGLALLYVTVYFKPMKK